MTGVIDKQQVLQGSKQLALEINDTRYKESTVLSRASAHGRSQLNHQILRLGGYTENSLKWFNYPHARAPSGCKVSCHGIEWTCIVGSSVIRRGPSDSGESCIVLQSRSTRSLIAKFP